MAVPNLIQFVNGTAADADQVNQNFDTVKDYIDAEVFLLDGSKSMSGDLDVGGGKLLRVAAPTANTDGANKQYADSVIDVGIVQMFAGPTTKVPPKWLPCDGRAVNRISYSALYNVIGDAYGAGDGATTFNLPNFNGANVPGSVNPDGVTRIPYPAAPGARGGSNDAVVVSHNHTQNEHNHGWSGTAATIGGGGHEHVLVNTWHWVDGASELSFIPGSGQKANRDQNYDTQGGGGHSHAYTPAGGNSPATATNQPAGVSGAGANVPATLGFVYMIRTGV
jgi:microcystin-dependent protein